MKDTITPHRLLDIITVTKDDYDGVVATIKSTRLFRMHHNVRQIVVDSSVPETSARLENHLRGEENVDFIRQAPAGIAAAFNLGLARSQSKWVWFLNGRDEARPDVKPDNILYLLENSRAGAMIFQIERMQSKAVDRHPPLWSLWPPVSLWIPQPAAIVRRSLFLEFGNFDNAFKIAMDGDIWFRFFARHVPVDILSIPLTRYDEAGLSSTQSRAAAEEVFKILKRNLPKMARLWIGEALAVAKAFIIFNRIRKSRP